MSRGGYRERPGVIYDIRHVTTYEYGSTVTFNYCALRLLPQDGPGQRVLQTRPAYRPGAEGDAGAHLFLRQSRHLDDDRDGASRADVEATSVVEIDRLVLPDPAATGAWEFVREDAFASESLGNRSPAQYLHPSRYVPRFAPATDYARESFTDGRPVLDRGGADAPHPQGLHLRPDLDGDLDAAVAAFAQKSGVCQDFAHIMIAGLRGLGLPAAYISGYIRTIPLTARRSSKARMPSAWVSLWCGDSIGWVGLNPTNSVLVNNDHVMLAKCRHSRGLRRASHGRC